MVLQELVDGGEVRLQARLSQCPPFPGHMMYRAILMGETFWGSRREMAQNSKKLFKFDV
jgi:hypothetical protein